MKAKNELACAASRGNVRWLQERIVKATQPSCCETAFGNERLKGLSGINGNIYVSFLGGLGAVMPPGYPASLASLCVGWLLVFWVSCGRGVP